MTMNTIDTFWPFPAYDCHLLPPSMLLSSLSSFTTEMMCYMYYQPIPFSSLKIKCGCSSRFTAPFCHVHPPYKCILFSLVEAEAHHLVWLFVWWTLCFSLHRKPKWQPAGSLLAIFTLLLPPPPPPWPRSAQGQAQGSRRPSGSGPLLMGAVPHHTSPPSLL